MSRQHKPSPKRDKRGQQERFSWRAGDLKIKPGPKQAAKGSKASEGTPD